MFVKRDTTEQKEIDLMINHIISELVVEFGKDEKEAIQLIKKSKVDKSLKNEPVGFHESPYNWALSILTENDDFEALEKHLYH